jgi:NADH dehydrogenase
MGGEANFFTQEIRFSNAKLQLACGRLSEHGYEHRIDTVNLHRVVVIGGGFAGLQVVRDLKRAHVAVTLVERRNFTLFQPLLYQVATGVLSPANISTPLRSLLAKQSNARIVMSEAIGFDLRAGVIETLQGLIPYDTLVVACCSRHHYFGHPEWESFAPGLKSLEDAEDIRGRIFSALEAAEQEVDPVARQRWLTFVVVGGGPTSVELAGAVAEITKHTIRDEFRSIDLFRARVVLIEAEARVLGGFSVSSSTAAALALSRLGVEVMVGHRISDITAAGVAISGADSASFLAAGTVIWGAGVRASSLGARLAEASGAALAAGGRLFVSKDCTLPGFPGIFVLGDMAFHEHNGKSLPGVAQVAIQQGSYVARVIMRRMRGFPSSDFRYRDLGTMATIGKRLAVADIGDRNISGRFAWIIWLVLHLFKLIRVDNRLLVLIQWLWSYATWGRNTRLITGCDQERRVRKSP